MVSNITPREYRQAMRAVRRLARESEAGEREVERLKRKMETKMGLNEKGRKRVLRYLKWIQLREKFEKFTENLAIKFFGGILKFLGRNPEV